MDDTITNKQQVVEALLMASDVPLSVERLQQLLSRLELKLTPDAIKEILETLVTSTENHAFMLQEVAGGWRYQIRPDYSQWVQLLWEERPPRYSRALLEILAIIAYRQPITRPEIEQIRGVAVSSSIIKTLSEREWVRVVGHRDVPGSPALYATTKHFLNYFNLKSLEDLPALSEFESFENSEKLLEEIKSDVQLSVPVPDNVVTPCLE